MHAIPSFAPIGRIGFTFSPLGRVETMREEAQLHVQHFEAQGELREEDIRPRGINIPLVDLAGEMDRQVVVDRESGQYLGHPTTVLLEDGETILTVYPKGHRGGQIVMKRSPDGGKTWSERLDVPDNWSTSKEVPTIYPVRGPEGDRRLILFSGLYPIRMAVSEDGGETWSPLEPERGPKTPAEDAMTQMYAHCTFNLNPRAPSYRHAAAQLRAVQARRPHAPSRLHRHRHSRERKGPHAQDLWR